jgi:amino acid transporter
MKKNVLTYGLIIGIILCIHMVLLVNVIYNNPNVKANDIVGYAAMVVMFSLIFFGVRNYRNKQLNGIITFGKAFKTGALIALVGSTIYVIVWLFYYYLFVPDFIEVYTERVLNTCSPSDLEAKTEQMASFKEMYKNPLFIILITYSEVLPIGLVVALVSALILKKKQKTNE